MEIVEIKIIKNKLADNRIDSFWYHGEQIAIIEREDGTKLLAEARGEIEMRFEENGTKFKGDNAVIEALNLNWTDDDLNDLSLDDIFIFNNWFVVIELDANGDCGDDLAIGGDYDEIIELLKEVNEEN
jgi:hypothetical protein|tara:strand:- start:434 stop:817 length:384 start_codon:yes stop_codon:yes gene_type:complete